MSIYQYDWSVSAVDFKCEKADAFCGYLYLPHNVYCHWTVSYNSDLINEDLNTGNKYATNIVCITQCNHNHNP